MKNGHANGSGRPHGDDHKIASLEEARQRAAARAKAEKRAARPPSSLRDYVIGAVFIAMALGMIWHWLSPLVGATGLNR